VTPPVVGCVSTEIEKPPCWCSRDRAPQVLAICIRLMAPSCMRAPPEHEKMISGRPSFRASSAALAIFSPTTMPMEPPRKVKFITAMTQGMPLMVAVPVSTASGSPVLALVCTIFSP